MKKISLWGIALLVSILSLPLVTFAAEEQKDGEKETTYSMYSGMMEQRKEMMEDTMKMMKETMGILKNLNHSPSAEQKKKLDEMMSKLDDMIKKHDAMYDEMLKQMKDRRQKRGQ
ncbi:MAG: hypothetical protein OEV28_10930 [Nitrospirota bacterium]|nr:hypothetical protein [Nitrospirota bacterium]